MVAIDADAGVDAGADAIDADADAYVNRRVLLGPPRSVGHIIASL